LIAMTLVYGENAVAQSDSLNIYSQIPIGPQLTQPNAVAPLRLPQGTTGPAYDSYAFPRIEQPADRNQLPRDTRTPSETQKTVDALGKKLTVVAIDDNFKLLLSGAIITDAFWSNARLVAPGIPFFLSPASPFGLNQHTFDISARQTNLAVQFVG